MGTAIAAAGAPVPARETEVATTPTNACFGGQKLGGSAEYYGLSHICVFMDTKWPRAESGLARAARARRRETPGAGRLRPPSTFLGGPAGGSRDRRWTSRTSLTGGTGCFVKVDPRNWFRESNERNNVAWIDFVLSDSLLVKVLGRSPRL